MRQAFIQRAGLEPNRDFNIAMTAVKEALLKTQSDDTRAEFICALALVWPDGQAVSVEGKIQGILNFQHAVPEVLATILFFNLMVTI